MVKNIIKILCLVSFAIICAVSCDDPQHNNNNAPAVPGNETVKVKTERNVKVTFIELGSVRCIPCRKMLPIMKEVEKEYGDQVDVVFHDVWTEEGQPYAGKYGIKMIPTQVFLDENGKEYFRHVGFFPKEELVDVLKQKGVK